VSPSDSLRAIAGLARAYALSGEPDKARTLLDDLVERSGKADITPYIVAKVFSLLGETDLACEWLERVYRERSPYLTTFKIDPELVSIRSDPRFRSLLKWIGLD
jgi:hypothetical protein